MKEKTNAGNGLGVAGLVLGMISLIIAFIPCIGFFAIFPGFIAVVLSVVGLSQANRGNGSKGVIIGGLIVSILSLLIAIVWGVFLAEVVKDGTRFKGVMDDVLEEIEKSNMKDDVEDAIEDLEEELEELEDLDIEVKVQKKVTNVKKLEDKLMEFEDDSAKKSLD